MIIPDGKEVYTMHCDCHGPVKKLDGAASPTTSHRRRGWKMFRKLTPSLRALAASPEGISGEHIQALRSL